MTSKEILSNVFSTDQPAWQKYVNTDPQKELNILYYPSAFTDLRPLHLMHKEIMNFFRIDYPENYEKPDLFIFSDYTFLPNRHDELPKEHPACDDIEDDFFPQDRRYTTITTTTTTTRTLATYDENGCEVTPDSDVFEGNDTLIYYDPIAEENFNQEAEHQPDIQEAQEESQSLTETAKEESKPVLVSIEEEAQPLTEATETKPQTETLEIFPYTLLDDEFTKIVVSEECELSLVPENYSYNFYSQYTNFSPDYSLGFAKFYVISVFSKRAEKHFECPCIYFCFENIGVIDQLFFRNNLKISHLVWKRDGSLSGGGGKASHNFLLPLAAKCETDWLFIWDNYINEDEITIKRNAMVRGKKFETDNYPEEISEKIDADFEITLKKFARKDWDSRDKVNFYQRISSKYSEK